jgi:raffinose/stachyose/melibiose transport system substrate-binding protein
VASGKVKALDDLYAKDKAWSDQIIASQVKPFTFNGKIYGVPLTIDGKAFFYNKDIFDKHGLTVPKTFDEFIALLEKLKGLGYKTPIIEGLADAWAVSHILGTMNQRMLDPTVLKKDYTAKTGEFTDTAYIKVLENFKKLTTYMGPSATSIDHETARSSFARGEAPIMYMQFAEIKTVSDIAKINLGFFDFPKFADGKGSPTALTGAPEGYMLSNVSKAPEAVEKFLKFLTSKENAAKFTKQAGQVNAIKGAVTTDNASKQTLEAYSIILNASETTPWLDNAVNINIADIFMRGGQSLATGEMKPEDVMKNVQKAAQEVRNSAK